MTEPRQKIEPIQSLRGVAILAVFLVHAVIWFAVVDALGGGSAYYTGNLGVDLFFIISGFVVTMSLHNSGFAVPAFYVKRIFRLMPAMFVMLALGIVLALIAKEHYPEWPYKTRSVSEPFRQALYVLTTAFVVRLDRGRPNEYCFAHTWSLNVEEQFYLAVGLICSGLALFIGRAHRDRKLAVLGIIAFVGCAALHGFRVFQADWAPEPGAANLVERLLMYLVTWRFDFMLSGVALYAGSSRLRLRVPGPFWTTAILLLTTFAPFLYMGWTGLKGNPPSTGWAARTAYLAVNVSFAISVFLASRNVPLLPRGSIVDRALQYLGERSYAIYVLHFPFTLLNWMLIFDHLPHVHQSQMTQAVFSTAGIAILTLPAAHAVHRFVELPGIALGSRLARRWFPSV